jgi:DNA-binding NarL/FixJ family response regulator
VSIRLLLADDQPLMRAGFRMILEETDDIDIVGEARDGAEAVRLAGELNPDVILMDVRMPGVDGIEATRRIVAARGAARVLILTTFDLDEYAFSALRAGASGFVLKDVPLDELARAIRSVASGDAVVSPRITRRLLDIYAARLPDRPDGTPDPARAALGQLTPREQEVLLEVATGLSNTEIAAKLVVSEATVKTHVGSILAKLGLRSRVQAVIFAYDTGLVRLRELLPQQDDVESRLGQRAGAEHDLGRMEFDDGRLGQATRIPALRVVLARGPRPAGDEYRCHGVSSGLSYYPRH